MYPMMHPPMMGHNSKMPQAPMMPPTSQPMMHQMPSKPELSVSNSFGL